MSSITILSAICHFSWRRTSDKLPVMGQASAVDVCFCTVCIKLFSVFLLSLEFWHYFFAYLLGGNIYVFLKSNIVCCHQMWPIEHHRFWIISYVVSFLTHFSRLDSQEEMLGIQGYCSSSGERIMQIIKGAFPVRSVKNFVLSKLKISEVSSGWLIRTQKP